MGAVSSAFIAAFADATNSVKASARALGATIEAYVAAPRTLSNNAAANPTSPPGGYVARLIGADGANPVLTLDSFGGVPQFFGRRANGTGAAPTAIVNADVIGDYAFGGYYVAGGPGYGYSVFQRGYATENWTSTARGAKVQWGATPNGSTTPIFYLTLDQDGTFTSLGRFGYQTGAGGTVTQNTSKATGVTLNKICGEITMNNAALAADTTVSFGLTNSLIGATDVIMLNHISGGTLGAYTLNGRCAAGSATIDVRNVTAGSLSEAIVIRYAVIKAANS